MGKQLELWLEALLLAGRRLDFLEGLGSHELCHRVASADLCHNGRRHYIDHNADYESGSGGWAGASPCVDGYAHQ